MSLSDWPWLGTSWIGDSSTDKNTTEQSAETNASNHIPPNYLHTFMDSPDQSSVLLTWWDVPIGQ